MTSRGKQKEVLSYRSLLGKEQTPHFVCHLNNPFLNVFIVLSTSLQFYSQWLFFINEGLIKSKIDNKKGGCLVTHKSASWTNPRVDYQITQRWWCTKGSSKSYQTRAWHHGGCIHCLYDEMTWKILYLFHIWENYVVDPSLPDRYIELIACCTKGFSYVSLW